LLSGAPRERSRRPVVVFYFINNVAAFSPRRLARVATIRTRAKEGNKRDDAERSTRDAVA
jgi:hypothetical protein